MDHVLRCSGYELMKSDMVRAEGCYLYDAQDWGLFAGLDRKGREQRERSRQGERRERMLLGR